jgi:PAS domain S-box-containing protein
MSVPHFLTQSSVEARGYLAAIVDSSDDAIISEDLHGTITSWNRAAERIFGYKGEEVIGGNIKILIDPDHQAQEAAIFGRITTGERVEHFKTTRRRKDGTRVPVSLTISPVRDAEGKVVGASEIARDISEQQSAMQAAAMLAAIVDSSDDAIVSKDLEGTITTWNRGAERIFGYAASEVIGRPISLLVPADRGDEEPNILRRIKAGQRIDHFQTLRVRKDGRTIPVSVTISPIKDPTGRIIGASKVARDISNDIAAEDRVHAERDRLRVTLASIGDAVIVTDVEARVTFLNPIAEMLTGWTQAEAEGQPLDAIFRIVNETTRRAADNPVRKAIRDGIVIGLANHTVLIARNGVERAIDDSAAPIRTRAGEVAGVILVFRDVTPIRAWERGLAQLAAIIESSDDAIISKDLTGRVTSWNKAAQRIFGYTAEEMIGKPITILIPPERLGEEAEILQRLKRGERVDHFESIRITKDGRKVELSLTISPIKDSENHVVGASKIARDITQTKLSATALKQAQQALAEHARNLEQTVAERTAALREIVHDLESFSYSISHDLRAPLRAMQGFANVLAEEHSSELSPAAADFVRRIAQSAARMDKLIHDVLDYTRIARSQLDIYTVTVEPLLRGIIESYPMLQSPHAEIRIEGTFPDVLGNEAGLTQCFSNLLGNAVKFVAPGVAPRVRVWAEPHEDRVRLFFQDNGIGIEKESQEKIFGIFERLNSHYQGTGIGLAIVKKAADKMGAFVGVDSKPDHGSRFWIDLQRAKPTDRPAPPAPDVARHPSQTEQLSVGRQS